MDIHYVHNFRLGAETVSLMSHFVRVAKAKRLAHLKLNDHAILFKMGSVAIATDDDGLNELFNKILISLNLNEYEIANCRDTIEGTKDESLVEWQNHISKSFGSSTDRPG